MINCKTYVLAIVALLYTATSNAQTEPTELDKSPMDMSYSPAGYPMMKFQGKITGTPNARVIYSRPQKRGRTIFGGEVQYNDVWRLGANENTELELYKDASIGGKKIAKGRYTLFCIPTAEAWTLIVNKDVDNWGNFNYNSKNDIARVVVATQSLPETVEAFTMYFDSNNNLQILWENVSVKIPISFSTEKTTTLKPKAKA